MMFSVYDLEHALHGQLEPLTQLGDGRTSRVQRSDLGVALLKRLPLGGTLRDVVQSGHEARGSRWNEVEIMERFAPRIPDRGTVPSLDIS